jgi:uncharacterized protein YbjT (DUF2867 family)
MTFMRILVTGGMGTLGRLVVSRLQDRGCTVRVLSRRSRPAQEGVEFAVGDLDTGAGIEAAVAGVETIIHCAGSSRGDDAKARRLIEAASSAGVEHLVNISVVGADRIPTPGWLDRAMFGYFPSKLAAEQVVAGSGIGWTTLRATQFHELLLLVTQQLAKLPVVPVIAGFRFQPVDAGEVADRLVELALGAPAGLVTDLAGPKVYAMSEVVRSYLTAVGRRRRIVQVPLPGQAARAVRSGANLAPERAAGRRTWEEFLVTRLNSAS